MRAGVPPSGPRSGYLARVQFPQELHPRLTPTNPPSAGCTRTQQPLSRRRCMQLLVGDRVATLGTNTEELQGALPRGYLAATLGATTEELQAAIAFASAMAAAHSCTRHEDRGTARGHPMLCHCGGWQLHSAPKPRNCEGFAIAPTVQLHSAPPPRNCTTG